MKSFAIVADATCDLSPELSERYEIDIIPGHLTIPGEADITALPVWDHIGKAEFFDKLRKEPDKFSTSPANAAELEQVFEKYAADGVDVLAMSISSGISGAHDFMLMARDQVIARHPDVKIYCLDSLRFGPGFGLMAICAAKMRDEGKSFDETVRYLEGNKNRFHQAGWLDDLSFVAKKGRINHAEAFFGSLVGIKPIGEFDKNGLTTVLTKAKGARNAYKLLLDYIGETIISPEEQTIVIAETDREKQALEYRDMIIERFHPKEVIVCDVHPLCGVNIGPGLMAAYYIGSPISDDLSKEREIISKITGV